jgi:hypothetical protein
MRKSCALAIGLVLVPLAGCAGLQDQPVLAPLDTMEPGTEPLAAADAEAADLAAAQIKSAVIAGTLLVGGQAAARMLAPAQVIPAAKPADAASEDESSTAAEVRRTAAFERMTAEREAEQQSQRRQAQLLEQWMSTRVEPARLSREDIRRGQRLLAELGFDPGPIDGFMGPRTRAAIEAFQDAQSIEVTGEMTRSLIDLLAIQET